MKMLSFSILILFTFNAYSTEEIIIKYGSVCPSQYTVYGNMFCKPISKDNLKPVIPKLSVTCPTGYRIDSISDYCIGFNINTEIPIPNNNGFCPPKFKFDKHSGYCIKY